MIEKTKEEIAIMAEGGARLGEILVQLLEFAQVGITLPALESLADELIIKAGGTASFKTVKGYKWATCLCVNDVVVHGIPNAYTLKDGDLLTIDVGMLYKGFHTDTAWTKSIGSQNEETRKFLEIGEDALRQAIAQARAGNRVGHISQTIQRLVEGAGYGIVKALVGHGVGRELHEAPQIPGFLKGPVGQTQKLEKGMTIAVEVIYAMGMGSVVYSNNDGWSIGTKDGSLSAVFEHTLAITATDPIVLTKAI